MANPNPVKPDRLVHSDRTNSAVAFFTILAVVVPMLFGLAAVSKKMRDAQDYSGWVLGCLAVTFFVWAFVVRRRKHVLTAAIFALAVLFAIAETGPLAELRGDAAQYSGSLEDWALEHLFTSEGLRSMARSSGDFLADAIGILFGLVIFVFLVSIAAVFWSEGIYQSLVQNAVTDQPIGSIEYDSVDAEDLYLSLAIPGIYIFLAMVTSVSVVRLLLGLGWSPGWLGIFVSLVITVLSILIIALVNLFLSLRTLLTRSSAEVEEPQERDDKKGEASGLIRLTIALHHRLARLFESETSNDPSTGSSG